MTPERGSEVTKSEASTKIPDGAAQVLAFIEKKGLTQVQFAVNYKISERTLGRLLARVKVSGRTWNEVAKALGVEVSELRKS